MRKLFKWTWIIISRRFEKKKVRVNWFFITSHKKYKVILTSEFISFLSKPTKSFWDTYIHFTRFEYKRNPLNRRFQKSTLFLQQRTNNDEDQPKRNLLQHFLFWRKCNISRCFHCNKSLSSLPLFSTRTKKKTTDDLSRTRVCLVEIVAHLNIKGCCNGAKWRNPFGIEMKVKWVFDVMLSVYLRAAFGNNKLR